MKLSTVLLTFPLFMLLLLLAVVQASAQDNPKNEAIEIRELVNYLNSPTPVTVEGTVSEFRKYSSTINSYLLCRMYIQDDQDTIWVKTSTNNPAKDRQYRVTGLVVQEGDRLFLIEQQRESIIEPEPEEEEEEDTETISPKMLIGIGLIALAFIIAIVIVVSTQKKAAANQRMMLEAQRQAAERERERIQLAAGQSAVHVSAPFNTQTVISDANPGAIPNRPMHTVEAWGQLKVISGPHTGLIAPLSGNQITIGRDQGDLQLPGDSMVSSQHAEIVATNDGRLLLVDKSRNGSVVDGKSVHRTQVELKADSLIEIGSSRIEIHAMRPPVFAPAVAPPIKPNTAQTMIGNEMPPIANPAATAIFTGAEFIVRAGADANKRFPLAKDIVTIGRLDDQDIVLTDGYVSKRHAICQKQGNVWVIRNVSDKGLFVNGESLNEKIINSGDIIRLGQTELEFSLASDQLQRAAQTICE